MIKGRFEVTIFLHNGKTSKLIHDDTTRESVEDFVSKTYYAGFLETNPDNPKRKIHIQPDEIRHIQITQIEQ
jgi:hypothetical protein